MSKLDDYISKLMKDDQALRAFLVDPIKAAEDQHGLTKAQRSVMRRVVTNLSNSSTNGYSLARSLGSYRRSLRLLQNVLHVERGHSLATAQQGKITAAATTSHSIFIYYNGIPDNPSINNPYAHYIAFSGTGNTIGDVMSNAVDGNGNQLSSLIGTDSNGYLTTFVVPNGYNYPYPGKYYVPLPSSLSDQDPFWFYSVNGTALNSSYNYKNQSAYFGYAGQSYLNYDLSNLPNSTIFWQVIAPDPAYGFASCDPATVSQLFGEY